MPKIKQQSTFHISPNLRIVVGGEMPVLMPGVVWFDEESWETIGKLFVPYEPRIADDQHTDAHRDSIDVGGYCNSLVDDGEGGADTCNYRTPGPDTYWTCATCGERAPVRGRGLTIGKQHVCLGPKPKLTPEAEVSDVAYQALRDAGEGKTTSEKLSRAIGRAWGRHVRGNR